VIGMQDGIFSPTYRQEMQLYRVVCSHQRRPDESSVLLTERTIQAVTNRPPSYVPLSFGYTFLRFMYDDEPGLADSLGVKPQPAVYTSIHLCVIYFVSAVSSWMDVIMWGFEPLKWLVRHKNMRIIDTITRVKLSGRTAFHFTTTPPPTSGH